MKEKEKKEERFIERKPLDGAEYFASLRMTGGTEKRKRTGLKTGHYKSAEEEPPQR